MYNIHYIILGFLIQYNNIFFQNLFSIVIIKFSSRPTLILDYSFHRHHEQQSSNGLGALPEDGDFIRSVQFAPTYCQRLLQDGPFLLRRSGLRRPGETRPQPRILGGQERRLRRHVPDDHCWQRTKVRPGMFSTYFERPFAYRYGTLKFSYFLLKNYCMYFSILIFFFSFRETIGDVVQHLRGNSNPQVEGILRIVTKWAKDNQISL